MMKSSAVIVTTEQYHKQISQQLTMIETQLNCVKTETAVSVCHTDYAEKVIYTVITQLCKAQTFAHAVFNLTSLSASFSAAASVFIIFHSQITAASFSSVTQSHLSMFFILLHLSVLFTFFVSVAFTAQAVLTENLLSLRKNKSHATMSTPQ